MSTRNDLIEFFDEYGIYVQVTSDETRRKLTEHLVDALIRRGVKIGDHLPETEPEPQVEPWRLLNVGDRARLVGSDWPEQIVGTIIEIAGVKQMKIHGEMMDVPFFETPYARWNVFIDKHADFGAEKVQ